MRTVHQAAGFGTLFSTFTAFTAPVHQSVTSVETLYDRTPHLTVRPWVEGVVTALGTWRERARARRELLGLDPHVLQDIGLTRAEVVREAAKPFWRD